MATGANSKAKQKLIDAAGADETTATVESDEAAAIQKQIDELKVKQKEAKNKVAIERNVDLAEKAVKARAYALNKADHWLKVAAAEQNKIQTYARRLDTLGYTDSFEQIGTLFHPTDTEDNTVYDVVAYETGTDHMYEGNYVFVPVLGLNG